MSTAVANPPVLSLATDTPNDAIASPQRHAPTMTSAAGTPSASATATPVLPKQPSARSSPRNNVSPEAATRSPASGKPSPPSSRAKVRVKKEPASPTSTTSRPRPRRLDLSASTGVSRGPQTAGAAIASKESAGLAIKDLGVACLSPGFQTHDPALREQLQRSLNVRDQQRQLIEARQKGTTKNIASQDVVDTPQASAGPRKKGPPPGLTIHAPAAAAFANERVVQSAPLGQSFTGLRGHNAHPPPRNIAPHEQSGHPSAQQGPNRLPPISDVFARDRMDGPPSASFRPAPPAPSPGHPHPPMYSPGYPPAPYQQAEHPHDRHPPPHHHDPAHGQQPPTSRPREFRSAEEAVHGMVGGREELLPKLVHYGGAQPPTPPSPNGHDHAQHRDSFPGPHAGPYPPHSYAPHPQRPGPYHDSRPDMSRTNSGGRRRTRDEYERDHDSPAMNPGEFKRYREEDWRHGMSAREKREEFLRLCERAWDLFHS